MAAQRELVQPSETTLSLENPWLTATGSQIEKHWTEQMQAQPDSTHFLIDKDDTLIASLTRNWVPHFVWRMYRSQGKEVYEQHLERIMRSENPFGSILEEIGTEEFKRIEQFLRFNSRANTRGEFMEPSIPDHLASILERKGNILGILTARPDTPKVIQLTHRWLQRQNLLYDLPLYHAPTAYDHMQTQSWKVDVLARLRHGSEESPLILIDDSLSTAKVLEKWNTSQTDYLPIMQIVPVTPLTETAIRQRARMSSGEQSRNGIYIAENWTQIPRLAEQATEWFRDLKRDRTLYRRRNPSVR